jgi:DNA topoisomerase-6 subunit B
MANSDIESRAKDVSEEELFKEFKEHSVAEFFKKNRQMLGLYGKVRSLTTILHEYVTNSLDACEEARILPEINIKLEQLGEDHYKMVVRDNGPGMPEEIAAKALGKLLTGTKFHRLIQTRGQQGIGAAGATMFAQMTTGKPIAVITGNGKKAVQFRLSIDTIKNEPKIMDLSYLTKEFKGTQITAEFKDVSYRKGEQGVLEYLRRTAIANPHAKISFQAPDGEMIIFPRTNTEVPKKPSEIKPHPATITLDELSNMAKKTSATKVSTFLKNDLERFGDMSLRQLSDLVKFDLNKSPSKLTWEECEQIIKAFKQMKFTAPSTEGLVPIGEERIEKSLKKIVQPEFLKVVTRPPSTYSGYSFQIEAAIAFGGNAGKEIESFVDEKTGESQKVFRAEIMRFANRVPLLFDEGGCAITHGVKSIDWKRYGIKDFESSQITVFVNLVSVHIPYTSAGKTAIADEPEILEEIRDRKKNEKGNFFEIHSRGCICLVPNN